LSIKWAKKARGEGKRVGTSADAGSGVYDVEGCRPLRRFAVIAVLPASAAGMLMTEAVRVVDGALTVDDPVVACVTDGEGLLPP
jgi:hypothetical protein